MVSYTGGGGLRVEKPYAPEDSLSSLGSYQDSPVILPVDRGGKSGEIFTEPSQRQVG